MNKSRYFVQHNDQKKCGINPVPEQIINLIEKMQNTISFVSNIFWIIYFLLFSCKIRFQNSSNYCNEKWITHRLKSGHGFVQQSVRNKFAKFKDDPLSRFRPGARQVFTTQKPFPGEIPLTMKTAISNSL